MNFYKYFFYRRYKRWQKSKKWYETAQYNALIDITVLSWINIVTLSLFLHEYPKLFLNKWFVMICLIITFIIHYLLLCNKEKYKIIESYFNKKNMERMNYANLSYWLYIILTIILPFGIGYILPKIF